MDSKKLSSPKSDCFPAGLRVLVVDDDLTCLKILENMLNKCNYQVTTCNLMREALDLLQERKDGFDIVISDVNMHDMDDGFKLLQHVALKMNLPVIIMSVDGETSRVMKGVQNGACDYLVKPIRMEELQNIWQHVYRKRIHGVRNIAGQAERLDELRNGSFSNGDMISGKKRKDVDNKNHDNECSDPSSVKKARVVWTVDLHHKFLKAVNQIGLDNVGPKKILDLMGVPWLTRANVASHLQKYRLHLSRLQKENEVKAVSEWIKLSDNISSTNPAGNVCFQNAIRQTSVTVRQNIVINGNYDQVPSIHSKQQLKPHFQSDHRFDQLRLPMPQLQLNPVSYNPIPSSREANIYGIGKVTKVENTGMANNLCQNFQFPLKNLIVGNGSSALRFWDEEFSGYCSQGDFHPPNTDLVSVDSFGYGNQELTADVPRQMYDSVNFDCEHPSDPIIDQRLYIE